MEGIEGDIFMTCDGMKHGSCTAFLARLFVFYTTAFFGGYMHMGAST